MPELWLKTADAAMHLAVSRSYLKRCRIEYDGGFLLPRKHYILAASRTASIVWNVDAVREAFHERGQLIRRADEVVADLVGAKK